jgi:hypothetical protein
MHLTDGALTTFAVLVSESAPDFTHPGILAITVLAICGLVFAAINIWRRESPRQEAPRR